MITFALFVWFTMKFVWPPLEKALVARQQKIAEGLAAAERGQKELEVSQKYAIQHIHEARAKAKETLEHAQKQAAAIIDQAKAEAQQERLQIVSLAHAEIEQERLMVKAQLQQEVVGLAIKSTEKLLNRVMTAADHNTLLNLDTHFSASTES